MDAAVPAQPAYDFDADTAVEPAGDGVWRGQISPRWSIGPYPNGGYVLAVGLAAVRATLPHPHPFAVSAHFLRPTSHGPVDIAVEPVRSGRGHSTAEGRMVQAGRERARFLATYGDLAAVSGPTAVTASPPPLPPPEDCLTDDAGTQPMPNGLIAEIRRRMDIRFAPGTVDFLRGVRHGRGGIGGWVAFADGRPVDVDALPFLCDAMPPAVFDLVDQPGWVPTLEYTVHVRGVPAPGWVRAWFTTRALVDGYLEEDGEIWDSQGRLVAMSRQLARLNPPGS